METRKSFSRVRAPQLRKAGGEPPAIIRPSSPPSGTDSPVRRKPASTGGESPTSAASPLPPSPPHRRKPLSETPSKLRKQHSADKIQTAGALWPSSKNPGPVATITTLRDHLIEDRKAEEDRTNKVIPTRAASTFSRRRGSLESPVLDDNINGKGHSSKGRRSKENHLFRYHFGKSRSSKKPGTPPSPSSSSSSGPLPPPHRLSVDENALGRRRSEFDLDFPSTESDRSETRNPSPRISRAPIKIAKVRRSGSPIRRSKSPIVRSSLSPVLHKSRSPVLHKSRSPVLHKPRSPVLHKSRSPVLIRRPRSPASPASMEVASKTASGNPRQSPDKGWNGGGMGSILTHGIGNLFRRKSFSGASMGSSSPKVTAVNGSSPARGVLASIGSPSRGILASIGSPSRGSVSSMGSPARGFQTEAAAAQHEFKVMHNQLLQWRFLNGGTTAVNDHKLVVAQKELESAWVGLSELQIGVAQKRMQLAKQKLSFKLKSMIYPQMKGLERWGKMEKQHAAALSSTADSFRAVVCRIPLTDRSKADSQILSILLRQATKVASEINANIEACNSMVQKTVPLVAKLGEIVSAEKPLIEECYELLGMVSNLQFQEESLRCQLIQLKS